MNISRSPISYTRYVKTGIFNGQTVHFPGTERADGVTPTDGLSVGRRLSLFGVGGQSYNLV